MTFKDRRDAGRQLGELLLHHKGADAVVYALPRGGVPVGDEVARALGVPLSLVISRKIGHPFSEEVAIGAVTESGERVLNEEYSATLDQEWLALATEDEQKEARRRREAYLHGGTPLPATGKTAIIVDDGVATGLTLEAAIKEIRAQQPTLLVVGVPVAPADTARRLSEQADEFVAVISDEQYRGAVGAYYEQFRQTRDEEVVEILSGHSH